MTNSQTPENREDLREQIQELVNDHMHRYYEASGNDSFTQMHSQEQITVDKFEQFVTDSILAAQKALLDRVLINIEPYAFKEVTDIINAELPTLERQQLGKEVS